MIARGPVQTEMECDGNERTAAAAFKKLHGVWPEEIEDVKQNVLIPVVGGCEACGEAIFVDEEYTSGGEDGILICGDCNDSKPREED